MTSTASLNSTLTSDSNIDLLRPQELVQWLAIVPDHEPLVDSLSRMFAGKPAAILKTPKRNNDFCDETLWDAIEQSLESTDVHQIVLVGSTALDDAQAETQKNASAPPISDATSIYRKLLAGASMQNAANRTAQAAFATKVDEFVSSSRVRGHMQRRPLSVRGLFYRSCDDLFLLYEPASQSFTPAMK